MATFYTIGHSTRPLDELLAALQAHQIQTLVDIRAFPMSRRLPQFNRHNLERSVSTISIQYVWMKTLGGYRKQILDDSPNVALRSEAFRNYADYMLTREFGQAVSELVTLSENSLTACMCAERHYTRCHRMLVSDWLAAHGHEVLHIDAEGPARLHTLFSEARLIDGQVIYRGDDLF